MSVLWFAISHDWAVLLPIVVCSILCLGVTVERLWYFHANKCHTVQFIQHLQHDLERSLEPAKQTAARQKGIIGDVAKEGLAMLEEHPDRFESMFDVTTSLATRELDRGLAVLGTIAAISPYLGLFGTVVRILLTFGELAGAGGQSGANVASVMFGIGSALIATAFGLGVAITAVSLNNYFRTHVERFVGDFEVLKLVLLSALGDVAVAQQRAATLQRRMQVARNPIGHEG